MQRAKRPVLASILASSLLLAGMVPATAAGAAGDLNDDNPGEMAMIGDAIFARPALFLATGVGLTLYTATLPFTILGDNAKEAGEKLVGAPASATFLRCLGCTPAQHEQRQIEKRTRQANPDEQED